MPSPLCNPSTLGTTPFYKSAVIISHPKNLSTLFPVPIRFNASASNNKHNTTSTSNHTSHRRYKHTNYARSTPNFLLGRRGQSPWQSGHRRQSGLDHTFLHRQTQRSRPVRVVRQSNGAWMPVSTPQEMQNRRRLISLSDRGSGSRSRTIWPWIST